MKKISFLNIFMFISLLITTGLQLQAADLPINGGYYRIKNYTSNTYIGGTGTGNDAVKHVDAATDPSYQVFIVINDGANGYTFKQAESGLFINHNNSWTGSLAATVTRYFYIDNETNPDYCILQRMMDNGSKSGGIGYDDSAAGSTLYMDKSADEKQNKWIFEPAFPESRIPLQNLITQATALDATALAAAITTAELSLTSTSNVEVSEAVKTLKSAILNYVVSTYTSVPVDITDYVATNADIQTGRLGWSTTGSWGIVTVQGAPENLAAQAMETWRAANATKLNRSSSQTITGLPAGKYNVAMAVFAADQTTGEQQPVGSVEVFAGTLAASVTVLTPVVNDAGVFEAAQVYTVYDVPVISDLTFGLRDNESNANWLGFDNAKIYYNGSEVQELAVSENSFLIFDDEPEKTFTVTGIGLTDAVTLALKNNTGAVTLSTYSISQSDVEAEGGVVVTATFDVSKGTLSDTIVISSGDLSKEIAILTSKDSDCELLDAAKNLIPDPFFKNATQPGWGNRARTTEDAYCGATSGKVWGKQAGSIAYPMAWEPNTTYIVRAYVNTNNTGYVFGLGKAFVEGIEDNDYCQIPNTEGEWQLYEKTFTTGANATATNAEIWLNNYAANTDGTAYIDNWELYKASDISSKLILEIALQASVELLMPIDLDTQIGSELGQYTQDAYNALFAAISDATLVYEDGGAIQDDINAAASTLNSAIDAFKASYQQQTNALASSDYYIKVNGYYVADGASAVQNEAPLMQAEQNVAAKDQIFTVTHITPNSNTVERYAILSTLTANRNINEGATFKNSWGDGDDGWRTMNIYYNGTAYAIQSAGSGASNGYWKFDETPKIATTGRQTQDVAVDFIFELISVHDVLSEQVEAIRPSYTAAVVGNQNGEYTSDVYNAFKAAIEAADAVLATAGSATAQQLVDFVAAAKLFIPNNSTGINVPAEDKPVIIAADNTITVSVTAPTNVAVYSAAGQLISQTTVQGEQSISVSPGIYLVKIAHTATKLVVR